MNSHELARRLLTLPDLPVATIANNHVYGSVMDATSHGPLKIARLDTYAGDHIVIGNMWTAELNRPNWFITEMFHGEIALTADIDGHRLRSVIEDRE